MTAYRTPYVGEGEDGARRSEQIDREEADGLSWTDPRHDELIKSAERWRDQAYDLVLKRLGTKPSLDQVRASVGSEDWLAALALLALSPTLTHDVAEFTEWSRDGGSYTYEGEGENKTSTFHPTAQMDWDAWWADVVKNGRGWSSTEHRLAQLVASLTASVDDEPVRIPLLGTLDYMGSWEADVWRILAEWGTGGNNREQPGRYTTVVNQRS